jgi:excisionase family DNA binding protein
MLERFLNESLARRPIEDASEIMSVKQVAQYLGLDANVIYAKCARGDIPYFKIGKQYRFKINDIQQWIQEKREEPKILIDDFVDRYMQSHIMKG